MKTLMLMHDGSRESSVPYQLVWLPGKYYGKKILYYENTKNIKYN